MEENDAFLRASVAMRVRELMLTAKSTPEQLADHSGLSLSFVEKVLNGTQCECGLDVLSALFCALHVNIPEFFDSDLFE